MIQITLMKIKPETKKEIDRFTSDLIDKFTPPEYIPGCKVLSITDKDEYATDNGWIEALCGKHNNQRCRWTGQLPEVAIDDFVDVFFYSSYKLFVVFGQSGTSASKAGQYLLKDGTRAGATSQAQDFGANGIEADTIADSSGGGIAVADDLDMDAGADVYPDGSTSGLNARIEGIFGDDVTPASSSFPGAPATGQVFFRTDLGWMCYYDGTRWLTVFELSIPVPAITFAGTTARALGGFRTDYAPYVTRVRTSILIGATNDGSNYWDLAWRGVNGTYTGATTILTETTSGDGAGPAWVSKESAPSTAAPANHTILDFFVTKNGSPTNIDVIGTLFYKLIVT